jgi:hypothetical protein
MNRCMGPLVASASELFGAKIRVLIPACRTRRASATRLLHRCTPIKVEATQNSINAPTPVVVVFSRRTEIEACLPAL